MKVNVGIYWVVNKDILSYAQEVFLEESKIYDSTFEHFAEWEKLPRAILSEYDDFPRGRVLFDNIKKLSMVYTDECISKVEYKKILARFGITTNHKRAYDEHYSCKKCIRKKDYLFD